MYAYLHHSAFDAFGLAGEAYRDACNVATNPSYFDGITNEYCPVFSDDSTNQGSWLGHALEGIVHGFCDWVMSTFYDIQEMCFQSGCDGLHCSLEELEGIKQSYYQTVQGQMDQVDRFIQSVLGINLNNATYQSFRLDSVLTL